MAAEIICDGCGKREPVDIGATGNGINHRLIVVATKHPARRDHAGRATEANTEPRIHLVANDLGEYMQFRAAVILGIRVLSVTMECGWRPDCIFRAGEVARLRERGIIVPPGIGWVQCEFQEGSEPPPLWFFHGRYGAIREGDRYRFLCRRDWTEPEVIGLLPREEFPPEKFDWSKWASK